jgi:DNA replication licensing factor MCM6
VVTWCDEGQALSRLIGCIATPITVTIRVNLSMNPAQMSSPPLPRSSLPPSSAPQDSQSPSARSSTRQATRRTRDALSFGDEANDAREDVTETSSRRKRRPRTEQLNGDVSIVKDAVGESVAEAFEAFLKT